VLAALAVAMASGEPIDVACEFAMVAAACVVERPGTTAVSAKMIREFVGVVA
jgi:bifunctional ADP-heptose synthase (sugar kinase/adenylyltransferase)